MIINPKKGKSLISKGAENISFRLGGDRYRYMTFKQNSKKKKMLSIKMIIRKNQAVTEEITARY